MVEKHEFCSGRRNKRNLRQMKLEDRYQHLIRNASCCFYTVLLSFSCSIVAHDDRVDPSIHKHVHGSQFLDHCIDAPTDSTGHCALHCWVPTVTETDVTEVCSRVYKSCDHDDVATTPEETNEICGLDHIKCFIDEDSDGTEDSGEPSCSISRDGRDSLRPTHTRCQAFTGEGTTTDPTIYSDYWCTKNDQSGTCKQVIRTDGELTTGRCPINSDVDNSWACSVSSCSGIAFDGRSTDCTVVPQYVRMSSHHNCPILSATPTAEPTPSPEAPIPVNDTGLAGISSNATGDVTRSTSIPAATETASVATGTLVVVPDYSIIEEFQDANSPGATVYRTISVVVYIKEGNTSTDLSLKLRLGSGSADTSDWAQEGSLEQDVEIAQNQRSAQVTFMVTVFLDDVIEGEYIEVELSGAPTGWEVDKSQTKIWLRDTAESLAEYDYAWVEDAITESGNLARFSVKLSATSDSDRNVLVRTVDDIAVGGVNYVPYPTRANIGSCDDNLVCTETDGGASICTIESLDKNWPDDGGCKMRFDGKDVLECRRWDGNQETGGCRDVGDTQDHGPEGTCSSTNDRGDLTCESLSVGVKSLAFHNQSCVMGSSSTISACNRIMEAVIAGVSYSIRCENPADDGGQRKGQCHLYQGDVRKHRIPIREGSGAFDSIACSQTDASWRDSSRYAEPPIECLFDSINIVRLKVTTPSEQFDRYIRIPDIDLSCSIPASSPICTNASDDTKSCEREFVNGLPVGKCFQASCESQRNRGGSTVVRDSRPWCQHTIPAGHVTRDITIATRFFENEVFPQPVTFGLHLDRDHTDENAVDFCGDTAASANVNCGTMYDARAVGTINPSGAGIESYSTQGSTTKCVVTPSPIHSDRGIRAQLDISGGGADFDLCVWRVGLGNPDKRTECSSLRSTEIGLLEKSASGGQTRDRVSLPDELSSVDLEFCAVHYRGSGSWSMRIERGTY